MSLSSMSRNSFRACQAVEQKSLEILRPVIQQRSVNGQYVVIDKGRLSQELQASYGDVFMNAMDGRLLAVELKAEERDLYGNLFIEFWSNRKWWNPGWFFKINADLLLYHFVEDDDLYAMSIEELRRWLWACENGYKPAIYKYSHRMQSKHEQQNDTWGVPIPIADFREKLRSFRHLCASTGVPFERSDVEQMRQECLI